MVISGRQRVVVVLAAAAVAASITGWAFYQILSTGPLPFDGALTKVRQGAGQSTGDVLSVFVILKLDFSSPSVIPASELLVKVGAPSNGSIVLPNGSSVPYVKLVYGAGWYPPWLTDLGGGRLWSAFAMTVTNPDGSLVTTSLPAGQLGSPSGYVEPGAILNFTLQGGIVPPGLSLGLSCQGLSGTAAATLG